MDAMALLCNLHADGPTTLRSLREGGCSSLEELTSLSAEALAELLGYTPAAARRFLREGQSLHQRLGGEILEREEDLQVPQAVGARAATNSDAARLPARERDLLARVMRAWHEEERGDAPASRAGEVRDARGAPVPASGHPAAEPHPDALAAGRLDGLDGETCRRLSAAGVERLDQLAGCAPELIDRATGLGYSRVRRLQFLARRRLDPAHLAPHPPLQTGCEEKISLAFPARPGPAFELPLTESPAMAERDAPGGPFA